MLRARAAGDTGKDEMRVLEIAASAAKAYLQAVEKARALNQERPPTRTMPVASSTTARLRLDWEVLPPGRLRHLISMAGFAGDGPGGRHPDDISRVELLDSLGPRAWYEGSSLGNRVYLVAVFDGVVIADSQQFGNALYFFRCSGHEWQNVFQLDKSQALRAGAKRLVHSGDWKRRVRSLVGRE